MHSLLIFVTTLFSFLPPPDSTITLGEISVKSTSQKESLMESSQAAIKISHDYLESNMAETLMQTLEKMPGVGAMTIGSGQSKPVIRGLGFNRLAVVEDGIKHEGQQWGDDHGLEIDQFCVDRAEVVKGPSALFYGSDAVGGVLSLYTHQQPTRPLEGSVQLFGRSNNELLGLSAKIAGMTGRFFYKAVISLSDYADYRVPTDSIQYYSYSIGLKDQRLRNTAGFERNGSLLLGYAGSRFRSDLRISDSYSKSGFFANAHGLEVRLSSIDYDASRRDINLPCQDVNHFKVQSHSTFMGDDYSIEANLAFQNNLRHEFSEPIAHGYMPTPDGTLERRFDKNTFTANVVGRLLQGDHSLRLGLDAEYQVNRRGGWGFILPDFNQLAMGAFAFDKYQFSEHLTLNAGMRYDHVNLHIDDYADWYQTPVAPETSVFKQRSVSMSNSFNSFTWSAGVNYEAGCWVLKANIGKGFRVPTAKEIGSDGVNYHIFRYEKGNASLRPEQSYQIDAGISWVGNRLTVRMEPYYAFSPNYIYLNPTAQYEEGLQVYQYTQARVARCGIEMHVDYAVTTHWEAELSGEYLFARQLSGEKKGYGLPFSPPCSAIAGVRYLWGRQKDAFACLEMRMVGEQKEVVPPEKPTSGYCTLNASLCIPFAVGHHTLRLHLRADNLLNHRYYDHTSYYRLMDIPAPGRSFSLRMVWEF